MQYRIYKLGAALTFSLLAVSGQAADTKAGKDRAVVCQGCHGSNGISSSPLFPNLAGQTHEYLETQLKNFKSGIRNNPMMQPIAAGLNESDMQNLAAYFAGLPVKSTGGDANLAKLGKDKAVMCMGCHGQNFNGQMQVPRLAGQHPDYLAKQLHDFKNETRKAGHMNAIAKTLSDNDIKVLSAYLASIGS